MARTASEFDRQVRAYADAAYPGLLGLRPAEFSAGLEPLRALAPDGEAFVLVAAPAVAPADALARVRVGGRAGFVSADALGVAAYGPIAGVAPPAGPYLLVGVERGDEYANWTPDEALPAVAGRGRTPLTIAEGIALLTVSPELLEKNRCFMLLGSRGPDKRVPALWISGGTGEDGRERKGAPKLGWCWAGNRHTWLGHASARARAGLARPADLSPAVPTMAGSRTGEDL